MSQIDLLIHQPVRLRLMATLVAVEPDAQVDFVYLRDCLKLTDGNLSVHLLKLQEAGYVQQTKTFVGRKPRTYVHLTSRGRAAFAQYVATLEDIMSALNNSQKTGRPCQ